MKFIVSLNYKHFGFETIEEAGCFACTAKAKDRSLDPDLEVKIEVHEDPETEDQED